MENLPESLYIDYTASDAGASTSRTPPPSLPPPLPPLPSRNIIGPINNASSFTEAEVAEIDKLISLLSLPQTRGHAIAQLTKVYKARKATGPQLAYRLWYSRGTVFSFLQEFFQAYRLLSPPRLTMADSTRTCNVLLLVQCMASHPEVRMGIIRAELLVYYYPLLNSSERLLEVDYLRVSGLGVILSLIKEEDRDTPEIINYLLKIETVPVCLHCMDIGSELTRSMAALVVGKILAHDAGKRYLATFVERFYSVSRALSKMVDEFTRKPPIVLVKNILFCYLRLTEISRCRDALTGCFPMKLRDHAYLNRICDETIIGLAHKVLQNVTARQQVELVSVEDLMAALRT